MSGLRYGVMDRNEGPPVACGTMSPSSDLTCTAPKPSLIESAAPVALVGIVGVGLGILLGRTVLAPKQPAATLAPTQTHTQTPTATQTQVNAGGRIEAGPWGKIAGDSPAVQKYVQPGNGATAAPYGLAGNEARPHYGNVISPEQSEQAMQRCWDQFVGLSPMEQGSVAAYLLDRYAFAQGNPYMGNLRAVLSASRSGASDWLDVQISALQQSVFAQNALGRRQFCDALYAVATAVAAPAPTPASKLPMKRVVPTPAPTPASKLPMSSTGDGLHASERTMTEAQIRRYKRILRGLGFTGLNADPEGTIGRYTRLAITSFQMAYNSDNDAVAAGRGTANGRKTLFSPRTVGAADGILGPNTRAALENYAQFEA